MLDSWQSIAKITNCIFEGHASLPGGPPEDASLMQHEPRPAPKHLRLVEKSHQQTFGSEENCLTRHNWRRKADPISEFHLMPSRDEMSVIDALG